MFILCPDLPRDDESKRCTMQKIILIIIVVALVLMESQASGQGSSAPNTKKELQSTDIYPDPPKEALNISNLPPSGQTKTSVDPKSKIGNSTNYPDSSTEYSIAVKTKSSGVYGLPEPTWLLPLAVLVSGLIVSALIFFLTKLDKIPPEKSVSVLILTCTVFLAVFVGLVNNFFQQSLFGFLGVIAGYLLNEIKQT